MKLPPPNVKRTFDGNRERCIGCGHPRREHRVIGCSVPKCPCVDWAPRLDVKVPAEGTIS